MKIILTLIVIILIGTSAIAQDANTEVKVETTTETVITNSKVKIEKEIKTEVARLYMFKNSRIKKALAFRTKRNKSKLA